MTLTDREKQVFDKMPTAFKAEFQLAKLELSKRKDWEAFLDWYEEMLDKGEKLITVERGYDLFRDVTANEALSAKNDIEIKHFEEPILMGGDISEMLSSETVEENDIQAVENLEEHQRQFNNNNHKHKYKDKRHK